MTYIVLVVVCLFVAVCLFCWLYFVLLICIFHSNIVIGKLNLCFILCVIILRSFQYFNDFLDLYFFVIISVQKCFNYTITSYRVSLIKLSSLRYFKRRPASTLNDIKCEQVYRCMSHCLFTNISFCVIWINQPWSLSYKYTSFINWSYTSMDKFLALLVGNKLSNNSHDLDTLVHCVKVNHQCDSFGVPQELNYSQPSIV